MTVNLDLPDRNSTGTRSNGSLARLGPVKVITRRVHSITLRFGTERQVAMKISQRTTPARATAALAVGLIAMPAAMAASHPAASRPKPAHTASAARASRGPGLTISISDGHAAARAGEKLTYTVSVRNSGTVAVRRLKVTQTLATGMKFLSASDHGVAAGGHVSWTASLPVGGKRTFADVTRVTKTPPTLLSLAAIAW